MLKTDKILTRRLARALPAGACALVFVVGLLLLLSHFQVLAQPAGDVVADDLEMDKQVNVDLAAPGDMLIYTITIKNNTTAPIDAWMTDSLPAELTLVSGPNAVFGNVGFENDVITWSYTLGGWNQDQITFSAQISTGIIYAELVNTAQITGDGELVEDSAETTVVAEIGNLNIEEYTYKSVSSEMVEPGDVLTYTIRIENGDEENPYPVPNARFTDELPPGLTYITGSLRARDPGATYGFANDVITWSNTIDYLGYDEVSFSAQISPDLPYDGWITNTVAITTPVQSFTRAAGTYSQRRYGILDTSTKSVEPDWARPGENLNYTIRVANTGDAVVESAWMTDTLPSEVSYVSGLAATTGSWGVAGDIITWTGSLAPSEAATITFAAQISSDLSENATFTNTAKITGAGTLVSVQAPAEVKTRFEYYFPLFFHNYPPAPVLNSIPAPVNRSYTVNWQAVEVQGGIDKYVLEQARSADFDSASIDHQPWTIYPPNNSQSVNNTYCAYYYRVRADKASEWGEGPWSNVERGQDSPPDPPVLNDIPDPNEDNSYTVSWSSVSVPVDGVVVDRYVLQEATNANFASVTSEWRLSSGTSQLVQKGSAYDTFYYRVRADDDDCWGAGPWSDVKLIDTIWSYYDDFSDYTSGWPREWSRTRGALYQVRPYEQPGCPGSDCDYDDGDGYVIARRKSTSPAARFGPGVKIPSENYEIQVKARWWDARYYATYQIFFGADSSLVDYYALQVRISDVGSKNTCMYSLVRRIAGDSKKYLQDWTYSGKIDCRERRDEDNASWNNWKIRREDNQIRIYVNGHELGNWKDSTFGANRYFGVGATLFEGFTPSKPEFDNFSVVLLE